MACPAVPSVQSSIKYFLSGCSLRNANLCITFLTITGTCLTTSAAIYNHYTNAIGRPKLIRVDPVPRQIPETDTQHSHNQPLPHPTRPIQNNKDLRNKISQDCRHRWMGAVSDVGLQHEALVALVPLGYLEA